jgi:hypothetical protein
MKRWSLIIIGASVVAVSVLMIFLMYLMDGKCPIGIGSCPEYRQYPRLNRTWVWPLLFGIVILIMGFYKLLRKRK